MRPYFQAARSRPENIFGRIYLSSPRSSGDGGRDGLVRSMLMFNRLGLTTFRPHAVGLKISLVEFISRETVEGFAEVVNASCDVCRS